MADYIGFQAIMRAPAGDLGAAARQTARAIDFRVVNEAQDSLRVAAFDLPEIVIGLQQDERTARLGTVIGREVLSAYGHELIARYLLDLCAAARMELGRSFDEGCTGVIQDGELTLGPDSLDWIQYWGAEIVKRWRRDELLVGPFHRVDLYDDAGGIGLWMGDQPGEGMLSRQKAAEYLNLRLRPIFGRNPKTGERTEIAWD